jgi:hypothetical protein
MLGEFKTPERFWLEAVNTACHAINRLYLHRVLKKTSYELLTSNKPNISYFRVFGSKCYILVKKGRHSKFAPKAVEGFLLGYESNTKAYRVFNKSSGLLEVSSDIVFDETNGSPREQVDLDDIDEDDVPTAAMRTMAIGDVRPQEQQDQDQLSSSTMVHSPTQDGEQVTQEEGQDQGGAQEEQVMEEEAPCAPPTQVRATIHRHHPVDQILGDISKGVTTRSRLANFCEHYSFVSSIEPFRVERPCRIQIGCWPCRKSSTTSREMKFGAWCHVQSKMLWNQVGVPQQARRARGDDKKQGSTCGKRLCPSRRFGF